MLKVSSPSRSGVHCQLLVRQWAHNSNNATVCTSHGLLHRLREGHACQSEPCAVLTEKSKLQQRSLLPEQCTARQFPEQPGVSAAAWHQRFRMCLIVSHYCCLAHTLLTATSMSCAVISPLGLASMRANISVCTDKDAIQVSLSARYILYAFATQDRKRHLLYLLPCHRTVVWARNTLISAPS